MTIDISNAFKANAQSTSDFLITPGQGCYIPAYQREYSWDRGNVDRLFEDTRNGLNQLTSRSATISFLGTVIAINDSNHATVQPKFNNPRDLPPKVMTIIDGQQRLSTFLLIFVALHDYLSKNRGKIQRKEENEADRFLTDEVTTLHGELWDTFVLDRRLGKGDHQFYPRLIRSYHDVWSYEAESAQYDGAIANVLWAYIRHRRADEKTPFKHPKVTDGTAHAKVKFVFDHIQTQMSKVFKGINVPDEYDIDLMNLVQKDAFGKALLQSGIPTAVIEQLNDRDTTYGKAYFQLFSAVIFARYMQNRMAFTVVEAKTEDDAFDMFEALNTTGEPLTAFETFEPKVIETEGLSSYQTSPSYAQIERAKNYLNRHKKADAKQKATSKLLIPFALAETGDKLGSKLVEQRRYLRMEFEENLPKDHPVDERRAYQRGFVRRLGDVADFFASSWEPLNEEKPSFGPLRVQDGQAFVSFEYLRSLNHTVTIAPLARFFGRALHVDGDARSQASADFAKAIKATAAFSSLWRGAFGGTNNIDRRYRDLMRDGPGNRALSARPSKADVKPTLDLNFYTKALRGALNDAKLLDRDEWVRRAKEVELYNRSKPTCRFLLMASAHNSVADTGNPGLIQAGRVGTLDMLTPEKWYELSQNDVEIEHIVPRSGSSGQSVHDNNLTHTIGNLTLLFKPENLTVSDRTWEHKRAIYRALAATTDEEFKAAMENIDAAGIPLSLRAEEVLTSSTFAPLLRPLVSRTEKWDAEFVEQRSERLLGLAWDNIRPWLD